VTAATTAFVSGFKRWYAVGVAGWSRASSAASAGERSAVVATTASAAIGQASIVPTARSPCGKRAVMRQDSAPTTEKTIR
jgi:hypothetical protein